MTSPFKVYCLTHIESGKKYVGITNWRINARLSTHKRAKTYIGNAIRRYGLEAFTVEILECAINYKELQEKEISWIERLNTLDPNGYNLTTGGTGGVGWKPESETRMAMSLAGKERVFSEEHRRNLSKSKIGNTNWSNSLETRKKEFRI